MHSGDEPIDPATASADCSIERKPVLPLQGPAQGGSCQTKWVAFGLGHRENEQGTEIRVPKENDRHLLLLMRMWGQVGSKHT